MKENTPYHIEKLRRTKIRKATRREKRRKKKAMYTKLGKCPCCGHYRDDDWDY